MYRRVKSAPAPYTSISENYKAVRRWTQKVDLFSKKYIIIPINEQSVPLICLPLFRPILTNSVLCDSAIIGISRSSSTQPRSFEKSSSQYRISAERERKLDIRSEDSTRRQKLLNKAQSMLDLLESPTRWILIQASSQGVRTSNEQFTVLLQLDHNRLIVDLSSIPISVVRTYRTMRRMPPPSLAN